LAPGDYKNRIPALAEAPEKYFNFLGLIIVRKADLLAATAFLLAAGSTVYQMGGYLWGAHLKAFAPDPVAIYFDHYSDGEIVTRVAGQLTFTNSGQVGRNGTVREAWVDLSGAGLAIREYWASFPKLSRDGEALKIDAVDYAYALQVAGQTTVSKLTAFAPSMNSCKGRSGCKVDSQFMSDVNFLSYLSLHVGKSLTLQFQATTFEGVAVTPATCEIPITDALITYLGANDWYMTTCATTDPTDGLVLWLRPRVTPASGADDSH
jgi:hypothetical protein